MEFKDSIKMLRKELGVTQLELATALHITSITISRWERGKALPNKAVTSLLMGYAYTHNVQKSVVDIVKQSLSEKKQKRPVISNCVGVISINYLTLVDCINSAPFIICVCDIESERVIYGNKKVLEAINDEEIDVTKYKISELIHFLGIDLKAANKADLSFEKYSSWNVDGTMEDRDYVIYAKRINWDGYEAQIIMIV